MLTCRWLRTNLPWIASCKIVHTIRREASQHAGWLTSIPAPSVESFTQDATHSRPGIDRALPLEKVGENTRPWTNTVLPWILRLDSPWYCRGGGENQAASFATWFGADALRQHGVAWGKEGGGENALWDEHTAQKRGNHQKQAIIFQTLI